MKTSSRLLALAALAGLAFSATQCTRRKPVASVAPPAPVLADFALIPGGEFTMGDTFGEGLWKDSPSHKVSVSAFHMAKHEATKAEWDSVLEWGLLHGYPDLAAGQGKAPDHPVMKLTWFDIAKWCNARSEKDGITPCYYTDAAQKEVYRTGKTDVEMAAVKWSANGYRLPTEAEWERAARGGSDGKRFPWGDVISHSQANFNNDGGEKFQTGTIDFHPTYRTGGQPYTSPVGSFEPNGYGLFDMTGNVWEWLWDRYAKDYYEVSPGKDPRGAESGPNRVMRGGGWDIHGDYCRVANRISSPPQVTSESMGFRLACGFVP